MYITNLFVKEREPKRKDISHCGDNYYLNYFVNFFVNLNISLIFIKKIYTNICCICLILYKHSENIILFRFIVRVTRV